MRTAIAVATTGLGMRFACDGTFHLWNIPLPGMNNWPAAPPAQIALYAPALVGAFEFSTAWNEFSLEHALRT